MLGVFIKKIDSDSTLTEEEKEERRWKLFEFWIKIRKKLRRLLKKLQKDSKKALGYEITYFSYWIIIKLICEGTELNIKNVLDCNLSEIKEFINSLAYYAVYD